MPITLADLAALPLFAGVDGRALQEILPYVQERSHHPGQVLALEGDPCRAVYLVARGLVRLRLLSSEGREYTLGYVGPGGHFDLAAALDAGVQRATADVVAESRLLAIPCERFAALMVEHPALARAVAVALAAEVRRLTDMLRDLALHTVRTRLARFLLAQADGHRGGAQTQPYWTQELIAANVGTVRDVVGRTLRAFSEEGLIRRERGRMVVVNREALEREARGE